jgi:hypothetical protein
LEAALGSSETGQGKQCSQALGASGLKVSIGLSKVTGLNFRIIPVFPHKEMFSVKGRKIIFIKDEVVMNL